LCGRDPVSASMAVNADAEPPPQNGQLPGAGASIRLVASFGRSSRPLTLE
jgi:hypothetical protein